MSPRAGIALQMLAIIGMSEMEKQNKIGWKLGMIQMTPASLLPLRICARRPHAALLRRIGQREAISLSIYPD